MKETVPALTEKEAINFAKSLHESGTKCGMVYCAKSTKNDVTTFKELIREKHKIHTISFCLETWGPYIDNLFKHAPITDLFINMSHTEEDRKDPEIILLCTAAKKYGIHTNFVNSVGSITL